MISMFTVAAVVYGVSRRFRPIHFSQGGPSMKRFIRLVAAMAAPVPVDPDPVPGYHDRVPGGPHLLPGGPHRVSGGPHLLPGGPHRVSGHRNGMSGGRDLVPNGGPVDRVHGPDRLPGLGPHLVSVARHPVPERLYLVPACGHMVPERLYLVPGGGHVLPGDP